MHDQEKDLDGSSVPDPGNSSRSGSVSRRTFLGIVAGAAAVCATGGATGANASPVNSIAQDNPVDLLPRLSPLPKAVGAAATPWMDLNGAWRFNATPACEFWKDSSDANWSNIQVPGEWTMQGFTVRPGQAGAYRLRFRAPADWAGHRIKIRFDAVYSKAEAWMNGKPVGSHLGAFTPFELDASDALLPGKDNILDLAVSSESLADILTVGREMVGHPIGGIIRKVRIFALPEVNISSLHVETTFDGEFQNATLGVLLDIANESGSDVKGAQVHFTLREFGVDGRRLLLDPAMVKLPAIIAGENFSHSLEIPVVAPKKWDAEHPNLYVLECELEVGNQRYSTERRFGFRQVSIKDGRLLLNGQPIRLRGMSRQDAHPLTGRTVPPEVHRQDIDWLRWANCNNTYCCAFLPDEESVSLCDEAGIYVLDEPGTCWVGINSAAHDLEGHEFWKIEKFDDPKFFSYLLQPVLEMIERDRSHPSVITWMLADESTCGKNFRQVLKTTRAIDPSRPVHMAYDPGSGAEQAGMDIIPSPFDLGSWHYPTRKMFAEAAQSERPVIFDQSASAYFANLSELMTDPGLRDEWGLEYVPFWEKLWETPSILGGQAFNLTDDQYIIPSGPITGNGEWGFIDPWRRAKPDLWHVKKAHTPVKIQDAPLPLPAPGQPLQVPVENRYDFTNLSEVRIEWSLGEESGVARADVPPHAKGTISIGTNGKAASGTTLSLKFLRNGLMVDAYKLPIGAPAAPAPVVKSLRNRRVDLAETAETITARGEDFEWVISRKTGGLIRVTRNGHSVLVGGPVLMVLPTQDYAMTPGYPAPRVQSFSPFNVLLTEWKCASVSARNAADGVEIDVAGQYKEAAGSYTIQLDGGGDATVSYRFTYTSEKVAARQIGLVFYAARSCDTLMWKRKAQWSVYPEDHIGRPEGTAKALPDPSLVAKAGDWMEVAYREKPSWPWFMDANALGTRDFRSTRSNILQASLRDASNHGVEVSSDGTHHTRCFLDGDRVGLLVAYYNGPAFDTSWLHGMGEIAGVEPMTVQTGAEIKDVVHLALVGP
ncbi:MAG: glycoside hydrolase family 2 TIM barrel-domain containing protein [Terriglobia bacterium]|jgi:beta-galactosidase